jgi:hypothetical protein
LGDFHVVALAQGGFEQDADGKREFVKGGQSRLFEGVEAVIDVVLPADIESIFGIKIVVHKMLLWHMYCKNTFGAL